jgi:hypothetical protein
MHCAARSQRVYPRLLGSKFQTIALPLLVLFSQTGENTHPSKAELPGSAMPYSLQSMHAKPFTHPFVDTDTGCWQWLRLKGGASGDLPPPSETPAPHPRSASASAASSCDSDPRSSLSLSLAGAPAHAFLPMLGEGHDEPLGPDSGAPSERARESGSPPPPHPRIKRRAAPPGAAAAAPGAPAAALAPRAADPAPAAAAAAGAVAAAWPKPGRGGRGPGRRAHAVGGEASWEQRFLELVAWRAVAGHCNVPYKSKARAALDIYRYILMI